MVTDSERFLDGDRDISRRADEADRLIAHAERSGAREDELTRRAALLRAAGRALALGPEPSARARAASRAARASTRDVAARRARAARSSRRRGEPAPGRGRAHGDRRVGRAVRRDRDDGDPLAAPLRSARRSRRGAARARDPAGGPRRAFEATRARRRCGGLGGALAQRVAARPLRRTDHVAVDRGAPRLATTSYANTSDVNVVPSPECVENTTVEPSAEIAGSTSWVAGCSGTEPMRVVVSQLPSYR